MKATRTSMIFNILLAFLLLSAAGCSRTPESVSSNSKIASSSASDANSLDASASEARQPEIITIGDATDESIQLVMCNKTGKTILALEIESLWGYPGMSAYNLDVQNGDKLFINIDRQDFAAALAIKTNIVMRELYDMRIVLDDGKTFRLRGLGAEEILEYDFLLSSDGLLYLEYTLVDGKIENTLAGERARKAALESDMAAQADAPATEGYEYDYDNPGSSGSAKQTGDKCVD